MRRGLLARILSAPALAALCACASASPPPETAASAVGVSVSVYQAPLGGSPDANRMPAGCHELRRTAPQPWSELDRTGSRDPYRTERAATEAAGGNVLPVLDRQTRPRSDFDCPAASPITDCPPSLGAWFDLVFVSYACSAPSLAELPRERRR